MGIVHVDLDCLIRRKSATVRKTARRKGPQVSSDEGDRSAVFVLTSNRVDRDSESVEASLDAADLTDFRAAGSPVLFSHDTESWPVGHLGEVWEGTAPSGEQAIFGRVHFSEANPDGEKAFGLCKESGLACSISFIPTERPKTNRAGGAHYHKWSLIELSLTPVPANPDATQQRHMKALSLLSKMRNDGPPTGKREEVDDDIADRAYMKAGDMDDEDLLMALAQKLDRMDGRMGEFEAKLHEATRRPPKSAVEVMYEEDEPEEEEEP